MPRPYHQPVTRPPQAVRPARRMGWLPARWIGLGLVAVLMVGTALAANALRGRAPTAAPVATPVTTAAPTPVTAAPTPVAAAPTPVAAAPTPVAAAPTTVVAPTIVPTIAPTLAQVAVPTLAAAITPSTVAAATSSQQTAGPFRAYVVRPGDTVRLIANTFGVSPASIVQASGLKNADQLHVGQVLTIPDQPGSLYRVQPGDTLDQIAARTGVPSERIASASNLASPTVVAGDVLLIPEASVASARGK